ncbi:MAG TPA: hypothetical protein VMM27_03740 [Casimicrobiaceae bacterium]|nr:hypothetical protein [Casimicrobiaceae bacterium]
MTTMDAWDRALHAVRNYVADSVHRRGWDDERTAELSAMIRSCVDGIAAIHHDSQRTPLDAIRHAVGYANEHVHAGASE